MKTWQQATGWLDLSETDRHRFVPTRFQSPDARQPHLVWLGHSSFYLAWHGQRIWIDPVLTRWVSLAKRHFAFPLNLSQLVQEADWVVLSHAHMDHFHLPSLRLFPKHTRLIHPAGTERFLPDAVLPERIPCKLGDQLELAPQLWVEAYPALHGGWRYPWQRGLQALAHLFGDEQKTVYNAGDTAYGDGATFRAVYQQMGKAPDIALLPIGAYSPRWFLRDKHCTPEEAVQAAHDLGYPATVIPCHFGTFRLSQDNPAAALPRFAQAASQAGIKWTVPMAIA